MEENKMMNTKAMNDEMLTKVTGGNWGDTFTEYTNGTQLYKTGDTVEVYNTVFHVTTKRAVVMGVTTEYRIVGGVTLSHVPVYYVRYADNSHEFVLAESIERK